MKREAEIHYSVLDCETDTIGEERKFTGDTARVVIESLERLKGSRLLPGDVIAACRVHSVYLPSRRG